MYEASKAENCPKPVPNIKPFHLKLVIGVELLLHTMRPHIILLLEVLFMKESN